MKGDGAGEITKFEDGKTMIEKIDHIGIAVTNIEEAIRLYADVFGLKVGEIETVEEQKMRVAMISVGESKIELLQSTDSEGLIAKYIQKRGEGVHHLAFEVKNIQSALKILREKGIPLVHEEPRAGFEGTKTAFLHPKATTVLIELVEC